MPGIAISKYSHMKMILLLVLPYFLPTSTSASTQYDEIANQDQLVSIHFDDSLNAAERELTQQWLKEVTGALLTVYGKFPQKNFDITIKRSSSRSSPVPWGQVERGKPVNVLLVINPDLGYDELISDWTAFHELSHLLLPYRGYGNIWLSEGLATYYQNIIQARSGLFDETEMWQKIVAGFTRGSNDQRWRHLNLTDVSDNLGETRQFMRVHWSGVLFWLTADVALRKQGKYSLDSALKRLQYCCAKRSMSAEAIVRELDELTNENIFVPLFNKYSKSYSIPAYEVLLDDLGVKQKQSTDGITFNDNAPLALIRQQISRRSVIRNES